MLALRSKRALHQQTQKISMNQAMMIRAQRDQVRPFVIAVISVDVMDVALFESADNAWFRVHYMRPASSRSTAYAVQRMNTVSFSAAPRAQARFSPCISRSLTVILGSFSTFTTGSHTFGRLAYPAYQTQATGLRSGFSLRVYPHNTNLARPRVNHALMRSGEERIWNRS